MISALENHLWQSTLFACVVGLLTLALRRNRAAVRHGLWLAASVKFLLPFSLLIGVGGLLELYRDPLVVQPQLAVVQQIGEPFTLPASPPLLASVPRAPSRLPAVLFGIWLCGVAANSLAWWRRWRRVRAALRAASPLALRLPVRVMSSRARLEPGVFGIRKPVLLLPEGITERLTPEQLQPILAHELCHLQRRDNLTAAIHMVVEALFWFHPLVWWIQARLVEERERACDEEVLRMAGDPQDYAEGILNVCKFYLESPLICVSGVTGSKLMRRVEAIMTNRESYKLNFGRKLLLVVAGMLAVMGPLVVGVLNAPPVRAQSTQSAAAAPAFEVASIRPVDTPALKRVRTRFTDVISGNRVTEEVCSLIGLIDDAYDVRDFQISGVPGWARGDRAQQYNVIAKTPGEGTPAADQVRLMLQALLADRFQLKLHRETKELPVYNLTVGKKGTNLIESNPEHANPKLWRELPPGSLLLRGPVSMLVAGIAPFADRPVIDKTGLTGTYDFPWPSKMGDTSIYTVIQELGLELKPVKARVEMLAIDHAEKPSEN